jgi:hypothetical protein
MDLENRAKSRIDALRESAGLVKEQRSVILDLKGHLRRREVLENRARMEEVRS